jgi:hypothetical protein
MTEAQRSRAWRSGGRASRARHAPSEPEVETFTCSQGYNDTADHIANFFRAIDTRQHVVEDEVFGHHAAIGCHMANYSYFHRTIAQWDADEDDKSRG